MFQVFSWFFVYEQCINVYLFLGIYFKLYENIFNNIFNERFAQEEHNLVVSDGFRQKFELSK